MRKKNLIEENEFLRKGIRYLSETIKMYVDLMEVYCETLLAIDDGTYFDHNVLRNKVKDAKKCANELLGYYVKYTK